MSLKYKYLEFDGEEFLTVYIPGESPLLASRESHANFDRLVELAKAKDESVVDEFDTGRAVEKAFADVVEGRVAVRGGVVYYDDDPQDGAITKAILRFLAEGLDVKPLVAFMDNVMANPQEESREQFYRWIETHDFPIDSEGYIVAFKGVAKDGNGGYTSISSGEAFVNGTKHTGRIPNAVGDVVTMPRSEVQHDPRVACHKGLHAGTWDYASNFARGAVMHVRINPRDVVSVPHDCTSQKVRVCRYEVIGFADANHKSAYFKTESPVVDEPVVAEPEVVEPEPRTSSRHKFNVGDKVLINTKNGHVAYSRGLISGVATVQSQELLNTRPYYWVNDDFGHRKDVWEHDIVPAEDAPAAPKSAGVRDTRLNHKSQPRDAKGHFIKKV